MVSRHVVQIREVPKCRISSHNLGYIESVLVIGPCDCHVISGAGHVIPSDHLLPLSLSKGPSGVIFDFTYQTRDNSALVR